MDGPFRLMRCAWVDEPVENRVGQSGVGDGLVPVFEGKLTGDECGCAAVAVLEHFQEVAALAVFERSETEVIDDDQCGTGQPIQYAGVGAVAACDGQIT